MTIAVEFTPEALAEARSSEAWYRARSERAAEKFVSELERALALLADNPHAGQCWSHEGADERVRRLPLRRFPFVLFYVVGDVVRVLAMAHARRLPGYWTERVK